MERTSWLCTVFTQLLLCVALYFALNLGQSQQLGSKQQRVRSGRIRGSGRVVLDFHFVTVRGGSRPPHQQTHLLKLMGKVHMEFDTKFVINISDLGEDDLLMQNGTQNFLMPEIQWYTTKASNGTSGYFHEQIKTPLGKSLDIVGVDTGLLRDPKSMETSDVIGDEQYRWLTRTLEKLKGDWHIFVGFHPLISWSRKREQAEENRDPMHLDDLLAKHRVNLYLSGMDCASSTCQDGIAYTENPGSVSKGHRAAASYGTSSILSREVVLLLHRVTQLKIVTYFINVHGDVIHRSILKQQGKDVM